MIDQRSEVAKVKAITDAIVHVSAAMKEIQSGRMTDKLLVSLIHDASGVPKKVIKDVLTSMSKLEDLYLKPIKRRSDG